MKLKIFFLCILSLFITCSVDAGGKKDNSYYLDVEATWYCPCSKCTDGDGITTAGTSAYKDGVATWPAQIPLGSHVDLPNSTRGPNRNGSWVLVDDTGGAIKEGRIDIRLQSHHDALKKGRKMIRIRVWPKE